MTIFYKAVTMDRFSISKFLQQQSMHLPEEMFLKYSKGEEVEKIPGSIGIACFRSAQHAINFMKVWREGQDYTIIQVEALSNIKGLYTIPAIWLYYSLTIKDITVKKLRDNITVSNVPKGTVFCDKVRVLT